MSISVNTRLARLAQRIDALSLRERSVRGAWLPIMSRSAPSGCFQSDEC